MLNDDLIQHILGDTAHPLAAPLAAWLATSPRFAAFVATYRDKIRKKLRTARDDHSARDLLLELETAYLLLQDRRVTIAYEPYSATKERAPDFAVTWTTKLRFNVEVTRMRTAADDEQHAHIRLGETVCGKVGQMLPAMPNVLVIVAGNATQRQLDVDVALRQLKQRIDARDERLFAWYGFRTPADFVRQYERLSAIVLRSAWDDPIPTVPRLWINRQAKQSLPAPIRTLLQT